MYGMRKQTFYSPPLVRTKMLAGPHVSAKLRSALCLGAVSKGAQAKPNHLRHGCDPTEALPADIPLASAQAASSRLRLAKRPQDDTFVRTADLLFDVVFLEGFHA